MDAVARYPVIGRHYKPTSVTADWRDRAACIGQPLDVFFDAPPHAGPAKAICVKCPVLTECRTYALSFAWWDLAGVYGGMTQLERKAHQMKGNTHGLR